MTYAGDGQALLGRSRGEQGSCSTEQQSANFTVADPVKQISTKCNCAATATGAAAVDILLGIIFLLSVGLYLIAYIVVATVDTIVENWRKKHWSESRLQQWEQERFPMEDVIFR